MTREEEIRLEGELYQSKIIDNNPSAEAYDYFNAFIAGANYADNNPNLLNNEKYQTVELEVLDRLYEHEEEYYKLMKWLMDKIDFFKSTFVKDEEEE